MILLTVILLLSMVGLSGCHTDEVTIFYSASLNGNLSGCDCYGYPVAGLVKRVAYLRERDHSTSLLLDAGNVLEAGPDPLLSKLILDFYKELGYDGIAVGPQEFNEGPGGLKNYAGIYPLLSHNLTLRGFKEHPLFGSGSEPLRVSRKGVEFGILSLIDESVFDLYPPDFMAEISLADPLETVRRCMNPAADEEEIFWIVLFHGSYEKAVNLAAAEPRIGVIIFAHEEQLVEKELENGVLLFSPGEEGNRIGILNLKIRQGETALWRNEFKLFHYVDSPDDPAALSAAEEYKRRLKERIRSRS